MITEFRFEVLLFDIDKGFNVLYTPINCNDCTPISQWIKPPPLDDESEILDQISKAAPQGEWETQKAAKNIDQTVYKNLVGQSFTAAVNTATANDTALILNPFESNFANEIRSNLV